MTTEQTIDITIIDAAGETRTLAVEAGSTIQLEPGEQFAPSVNAKYRTLGNGTVLVERAADAEQVPSIPLEPNVGAVNVLEPNPIGEVSTGTESPIAVETSSSLLDEQAAIVERFDHGQAHPYIDMAFKHGRTMDMNFGEASERFAKYFDVNNDGYFRPGRGRDKLAESLEERLEQRLEKTEAQDEARLNGEDAGSFKPSFFDTDFLSVNSGDGATDPNIAPTFATSARVTENVTSVVTFAAKDADGDNVSYSIVGGADQAQFTLTGQTLSFNTGPDYEVPTDAGSNNSYEVMIQASDGSVTTTKLMTVTIDNVFDGMSLPIINAGLHADDTNLVFRFDGADLDADRDYSDQPAAASSVTSWSDKSSNGHDASTLGTAGTYNETNTSVSFDGSQGLTIGDHADINTAASYANKTIAVEFTTGSDISGQQVVFEQGGSSVGFNVILDGGNLYVGAWDSNWTGDVENFIDLGAVSANTSYSTVLTFDGSALKGYLDGALVNTDSVSGSIAAHSDDVGIGRASGTTLDSSGTEISTASEFTGEVTSLAQWNRTLSADEIGANAMVADGEHAPLSNTILNYNSPDADAGNIVYTVTSITGGTITLASGASVSTFTQYDLDTNSLIFNETGSASTASFSYSVTDGVSGTPLTGTVNYMVTEGIVDDFSGGNKFGNHGNGYDYFFGNLGSDYVYGFGGDDYILGHKATDRLYGGDGNDYLHGGVHGDQLFGEAGNDNLVYHVDNILHDGGTGFDTLTVVSKNKSFDMSTANLVSVERINLTGTGNNTLDSLTIDEVLTADDDILYVDGNSGDTVTTSESWTSAGTETVNGILYDKYTGVSGSDTATLYIDADITQTGF